MLDLYLTIWLNNIMSMNEAQLDALFHALSDRTRRAILMNVRSGDRSVNEVAAQFDISLPAVSKHLGTLERAGLITRRKKGRYRFCHVEPRMLQNATAWLDYYQSFWNDRLEGLKNFVEAEVK